jgi:hypothetical protein
MTVCDTLERACVMRTLLSSYRWKAERMLEGQGIVLPQSSKGEASSFRSSSLRRDAWFCLESIQSHPTKQNNNEATTTDGKEKAAVAGSLWVSKAVALLPELR